MIVDKALSSNCIKKFGVSPCKYNFRIKIYNNFFEHLDSLGNWTPEKCIENLNDNLSSRKGSRELAEKVFISMHPSLRTADSLIRNEEGENVQFNNDFIFRCYKIHHLTFNSKNTNSSHRASFQEPPLLHPGHHWYIPFRHLENAEN